MLDLRLKMFENDRLRRGCALSTSSIINQTSHIPSHIQRSALTLIELLVVIVILTTLVGGVIPLLSPNNDERKIQVASRGLQGYIVQAQAQAARTGRPQGIAFRESSAGSGVALEVFGLEVPPPFAGFSTASAVRLDLDNTVADGDLYAQFILADTLVPPADIPDEYSDDSIPPNFIRPSDRIVIDGVEYRFLDTSPVDTRGYFTSLPRLPVERVDSSEQTLAFLKGYPELNIPLNQMSNLLTAPKRYKINRQPTNSTESPYQLPAGIVIDMQASVAEGSDSAAIPYRFPTVESFFIEPTIRPLPFAGAPTPFDSVGIMFSPTGAVDRVIFNGNELTSVSRIVLMLGRIENGGIDPTLTTYPWVLSDPNDKEEVEQKQETINWLNLDSRLLSIISSNGRAVVSEPAFVSLAAGTDEDGDTYTIDIDADDQLEAAHAFAHEMTTAK